MHLADDVHGGPADDTVTFGPDDKNYELDLPHVNAQKLREALRPVVVVLIADGIDRAGP